MCMCWTFKQSPGQLQPMIFVPHNDPKMDGPLCPLLHHWMWAQALLWKIQAACTTPVNNCSTVRIRNTIVFYWIVLLSGNRDGAR